MEESKGRHSFGIRDVPIKIFEGKKPSVTPKAQTESQKDASKKLDEYLAFSA